ncbi:hypothetical protein BTUL_0155g00160 [Botrytis tulipae]|uniref:Uncharacterized protein n=1 Tax=Botrytis tulipae TaxID=87230 RepID=A0A4Z1EKE8_9HELO|nr:hypothetical protein BTUL_0155g00160 [Botrytis tulipae]
MVTSQVSLGQSEGLNGKMIAEWAQEWQSEVVELANTNGHGWSERDLSELGENLMRTLAKVIDPILSSRVTEYYLNASQSATIAPLSTGGTKIAPPDALKRKYSSLEKPDTRPKLPEKNSKGTAKDLKKLASKESKVPPARTSLTRSRKSAPLQSGISRPRLQSPPKISSKNGLVNSSMVKNVTKDHDLRDDWLLDSQSNTVESQIPKKQQVRSYTYRKEKTVVSPKTLKLVIVSSEKADASRYEVNDSEWAFSESTLLRAIVYDKPHPIEQPGRLKMVIRNDDSITIKWNEVISDYARWGKPPAVAIQSWGLDFAFKALGPLFERVTKNSGEWETWSADELVKGSKVDWFICARDLHTI